MSFDWDSIKVVNNPELKEIEALFTPISSLGGIESPNEDGSPSGGNDGGDNGGGEDGGGNEQPVIVDCTPPSLPSKCRQRCDAYQDYVSVPGITMGTQAEMDALYGTGALDLNGFRFISKLGYEVSTGDDPNVLPSVDIDGFIPMPAGSADSTPCAPDLVSLNTRTGTDNNRLTALSVSELNEGQHQGSWTDDNTVRPPINRSISYDWRAIINPLTDTGTVTLFELHIPLWTTQSASGFKTQEQWSLSWNKTAGTITVSNGIVSPASQQIAYDGGLIDMDLGFVLGAGGTVASNPFDGVVDRVDTSAMSGTINGISVNISSTMAITTVVYGFFLGNHASPFSGTVFLTDPVGLYTILGLARVSSELDDVANAIRRSTPGFVATDADCLAVENWVRPEGCPDCVRPAYPLKCKQDCSAMATLAGTGGATTMGIPLGEVQDYNNISELQANNGSWRAVQNYDQSVSPDAPVFGDGAANLSGGIKYWTSNLYKVDDSLSPCDRVNAGLETWAMCSNSRANDMDFFAEPWYGSKTSNMVAGTSTPSGSPILGTITTTLDMSIFIQYDINDPGIDNDTNIEWKDTGAPNFWTGDGIAANPYNDVVRYEYYPARGIIKRTGGGGGSWPNEEYSVTPYQTGWFNFKYTTEHVLDNLGTDGRYRRATTGVQTITLPNGESRSDNVAPGAAANENFNGWTNVPINTTGVNGASIGVTFNDGPFGKMWVLAFGNDLSSADKTAFSQLFANYNLEGDADCDAITNWIAPDGCSENLCPEDDGGCPCYCGDFTLDPLTCEPEGYTITGGFYPAYSASDTNGVFPNYNGTYGRMDMFREAAPAAYTFDSGTQIKAFYNSNLYYLLGLNGAVNNNYLMSYAPYNLSGRALGTSFTETHEATVLVGLVDNQNAAEPPVLAPIDNTGQTLGGNQHAGRVFLYGAGRIRDQFGNNIIAGSRGVGHNGVIERRGPSTVAYQRVVKGNPAPVWTEVTLPASVLNPTDKFVWFGFKSTLEWEDLGSTVPNWTELDDNPAYTGYRTRTTCTYYVNGFAIATVATQGQNAYYMNDDWEYYKTAVDQTGKEFSLGYQVHNVPNNFVMPEMRVSDPSNPGDAKLAYAWMDMGPGAANLPNTTLGRNLSRINDTYVAPSSCNNCGDTP